MYLGKLVRLRPFEREDAERYRVFINDPQIARLVDRAKPVTKGEHERWYENLVGSPTNAVFAVERKERRGFIGLVWLYEIHWRHRRAEVRIVIGERRSWGGGFGTDALKTVAEVAFGPMNLEKLWADVLEQNPRAIKAFEAAGFVREGLLKGDRAGERGRIDVVRLGLLHSRSRKGR